MSLWGTTDGTKPKFLTDEEKKLVFANQSGWVLEPGAESARFTGNDNPNAQPEVLVAIGNLADSIGAATITQVELPTSYSDGTGGNFDVLIRYNEEVTVTGSPTILITNDTPARNITATSTSGSGSNELVFRKTNAQNTVNVGDELSIVAADPFITLAGGTIKDKDTTTDSELNVVASVATASGTLTVAA